MLYNRFVLAACLVLLPHLVWASPQYIRVTFMQDASESVGIAWTTLGSPEAELKYGTTPGSYTASATGITTLIDDVLGTASEVTLDGLDPSTTYYYRVGRSQGGYSQEHSFTTGPAPDEVCGSFRFVAVGDSRAEDWQENMGSAPMWDTILAKATAQSPAFIWHGGDMIEDGKNTSLWAHYLKQTSATSPSIPVMHVLGNHDDGNYPGGTIFTFNTVLHQPVSEPTLGGSGTEDFAAFTYGNAIFITLSTETHKGGNPAFADQAAWMDQVLTQYPKRWKFVFLHKPIYAANVLFNHESNEEGQNAALVPVINKHHVDIVFQSHNHYYDRFAPSACTNGNSANPCPVASHALGTTYVTTGGGGAFPLFLAGMTNNVRVAASGDHHFLVLDINNHQLDLKTINAQDKVIDAMSISKPAPAPDPCAAGPDAAVISDGALPDAGPPDLDPPGDAPPSDLSGTEPDQTPLEPDASIIPSGDGTPEGPTDDGGCSCALISTRLPVGILLPGILVLLALGRVRLRKRY